MLLAWMALAVFAVAQVNGDYKYVNISYVDLRYPKTENELPLSDTSDTLELSFGVKNWKHNVYSLVVSWQDVYPESWKNHAIVNAFILFYGENTPNTLENVTEAIKIHTFGGFKNETANFLPGLFDCSEIYESSANKTWTQSKSGIFVLNITENGTAAYCDMQDMGWTLIQRHTDNTQSFHSKNIAAYHTFFGDLMKSHWLGLETIFTLTNAKNYQLRIDLLDCDGANNYITYDNFKVSNASTGYSLSLNLPKTNTRNPPGDSIYNPMYSIVGDRQTTPQQDQFSQLGNAFSADGSSGGWWFSDPSKKRYNLANLNGEISEKCVSKWPKGMLWNTWHKTVPVRGASMKIRA